MDRSIFSARPSPLKLLERCSAKGLQEKETVLNDKKQEKEKVIRQIAEVAKHCWHMKNNLTLLNEKTELDQTTTNRFKTIQINLDYAFSQLKIELLEVGQSPYTAETGKHFLAITQIPSPGLEVPTIDKLVNPAVFHDGRLILKGEVQILTPSKSKNQEL